MKLLWKGSALALLSLAMVAPAMAAKSPVETSSQPNYIPYAPYSGVAYNAYVNPGANAGNLNLRLPARLDGTVYVDGYFVGMTGHVSEVRVTPGTHSVEVRDPDGYVLYLNNVVVPKDGQLQMHPLSQPEE